MKKSEAKQSFDSLYPRDTFLTLLTNGKRYLDTIMRDECWNNYTDGLCKDGEISAEQYESWVSPWR